MSPDRERGILTESDRRFLQDEGYREAQSPSARSHRWRAIRERLGEALLDIGLLSRELPANRMREAFEHSVQVLDEENDDEEAMEYDELLSARLPGVARFLTRAHELDTSDSLYPDTTPQPAYQELERTLEKGIERDIAARRGAIAEVDVTVNLDRLVPPEAALRELRAGEVTNSLRIISLLKNAGIEEEQIRETAPELFPEPLPDDSD